MRYIYKFLIILTAVTLVSGCAKSDSHQAEIIKSPPTDDRDSKPLKTVSPVICSTLDFEDVRWPDDYTTMDQVAFSLAINITGSYEGHAGWTNLSNNFDGQGFSMGILNQNLGQGTIQPLFLEMRDKNLDVLKGAMTASMLTSLLGMLAKWEASQPQVNPEQMTSLLEPQRELILFEDDNIDKRYAFSGIQTRFDSASVAWAKKTLYSDSGGRNFKPEWRDALKAIAGHPAYVSLQIAAARDLHQEALETKARLGWQELRSYLYLFDFVVQNGGLKDKHFDKFDRWYVSHPNASEQEQMLQMLEIRVVDSHPKWQKDVRSRKSTIILGQGYVHGENRDLPLEYCYDPHITY